ncbi:hypothetical protein NLG97_g2182 [Lecanicillium saksenae]|uniref:Uncharacterized protein n=1 Tax=Lecanicillium saksenae TaxID=468837 RepID=A0ACC1R1W4_9HYPO|nr:hypothetical protein NLG97_g2182 [Lecanicillium saksenae]
MSASTQGCLQDDLFKLKVVPALKEKAEYISDELMAKLGISFKHLDAVTGDIELVEGTARLIPMAAEAIQKRLDEGGFKEPTDSEHTDIRPYDDEEREQEEKEDPDSRLTNALAVQGLAESCAFLWKIPKYAKCNDTIYVQSTSKKGVLLHRMQHICEPYSVPGTLDKVRPFVVGYQVDQSPLVDGRPLTSELNALIVNATKYDFDPAYAATGEFVVDTEKRAFSLMKGVNYDGGLDGVYSSLREPKRPRRRPLTQCSGIGQIRMNSPLTFSMMTDSTNQSNKTYTGDDEMRKEQSEKNRETILAEAPATTGSSSSDIDNDGPSLEQKTVGEIPKPEAEYPKGVEAFSIMAALILTITLISLDQTIVATAIPKITDQFHSLDDISWYGSAYFVTLGAFQSTWGKVYKYFPLKISFLVSIFIFELGSLIAAVAPNSTTLIVGRAVSGVGAAAIAPGVFTISAFAAEPAKRATYVGIIGATYGVAAVCGPLIGGGLTKAASWRWCFYINLPVGGVAAAVIFLTFKTPKASKVVQATFKEKLLHMDPIATVLTMGALICILLALQYGGVTHAWNSGMVVGLLVGFAILSFALVAAEMWQGERAMLTPRIMRQRAVWACGIWGFFMTGAYFVTLYYLPIYFQSIDNVSPIASGVRSIPLIILFGVSTFGSGRAITKTGVAAPYMVAGSVIVTIAAGLFFTLDVGTSTGKWVGFQILAGFGYGISFQVPVIIAQAFAAPTDIAPTTAIIIFYRSVGGTLSLAAAQSGFVNQLVRKLTETAPNVDPELVIDKGATEVHHVFSGAELEGVLHAYAWARLATYQRQNGTVVSNVAQAQAPAAVQVQTQLDSPIVVRTGRLWFSSNREEYMMSDATGTLLAVMLSGEYSDLMFSCHGEEFKVHRAVVCPQSSVIQAALTTGFKEAADGTLSMDAFTPASVRRFVQFLYTKNYDYDPNEADAEASNKIQSAKTSVSQVPDAGEDHENANPADGGNRAAHDTVPLSDELSTDAAPPADETTTTTKALPEVTESTGTRDATAEARKTADRPETNDPVFKTILAHTRMNAIGDYYDTPELSKLANTRINALLENASPDAPWVADLPVIAETALEIVNSEGLTEVLTAAISDHIGTILAAGSLENSPLMTPFCLELLKKCSLVNQRISETLSYKVRTLNEVNTKYQKAADLALRQRKAASNLSTTNKCRNKSCIGLFDCYFGDDGSTLRCRRCHAKH